MKIGATKINKVDLTTSMARVTAPIVKVKIGDYSFGVWEAKARSIASGTGYVTEMVEQYPNFVQSLNVKKINGQVNQYTLNIIYPVTKDNDPNFFEKVFSSVSQSRKIYFTYGDALMMDYIYRDESAIITKVQTGFNVKNGSITYTVSAVSDSMLALSGAHNFPARTGKPSDIINEIVNSPLYGISSVFTGMKNTTMNGSFIMTDDKVVTVPTVTGMSALEYINYLVSFMVPLGTNNELSNGSYVLTTYDDSDNAVGGPYFKVQRVQTASNALNQLCTYEVNIGWPDNNAIVTNFDVQQNDTWSIYYDYNNSVDTYSNYRRKINDKGEIEYVYSPMLKGTKFDDTEADLNWWSNVTSFPINASITIKGLLKPAILMQYVKVNVIFYGRKHISSGYYIVTEHVEDIGQNGYSSTLKLLRVAQDEDF